MRTRPGAAVLILGNRMYGSNNLHACRDPIPQARGRPLPCGDVWRVNDAFRAREKERVVDQAAGERACERTELTRRRKHDGW